MRLTSQHALVKDDVLIDKTYPEISLGHLEDLTDRTGVIQHSIYSIPNRRTGYTTDDNSRALIAALWHYEATRARRSLKLVSQYLSFLHYAQTPNGKFHNFMSFDQAFLDGEGSEDCMGRTIWALGECISADIHDNVREVARNLFQQALWIPPTISSTRGRAYGLLGLTAALQADTDDAIAKVVTTIADVLSRQYEDNATNDWQWFEPFLTYSNGMLPWALFRAFIVTGEKRYLQVAEQAWKFLESQCIINDMLQLIGCNGWYFKGQERAWFDQQPVDATVITLGALDAYRATGNNHYLKTAEIAFDWFFGKNATGVALHDPVTGGCFDGLTPQGRNFNQGSESTVCCLLAQIEMAKYIKNGKDLFEEASY